MSKKLYLFILLPLLFILLKSDTVEIYRETTAYNLFDKRINIRVSVYGDNPDINFLVLHDDENTGVDAAYDYLRTNGGRMVELSYGDDRYIEFNTAPSKCFKFDPNGIFAYEGILSTLKMRSGIIDSIAADSIEKFAGTILKVYTKPRGVIITLHNNTDSLFSIRSYAPGEALEKVATGLYINPKMDPDDLVLVTEERFFNYLKKRGVNTVLQNSQTKNDGSLSVYAAIKKIPYINIEVQHGHVDEHRRLIEEVSTMLKDLKKQSTVLAAH